MISALEMCLNGLDDAELHERAEVLASLIEDGHAIFADHAGHVELVALPVQALPPLPWATA